MLRVLFVSVIGKGGTKRTFCKKVHGQYSAPCQTQDFARMTETKPFLKPADKILLSEKPWIIAAPMNGGINNPKFAASVINAGGIGSFGFTYHTPEAITRDIMQTRELISTGYINANFFIYTTIPDPTPEEIQAASAALEQACGYKPTIKTPTRPYHSDLHTQIEAIWQTRPEILTFHFGIPDKAIIREAQKLKILVGITATTLDEAKQIQEAGADFVVAQGLEAGGHRGRFYSTLSSHQSVGADLTTLQLVQSLRGCNTFRLPIVAAGGIMNGTHIHHMLQAGASAVQMGTAFLPCQESTASIAHKRYMLEISARNTTVTTAFSGRPARGIRNTFIDRMDSENAPRLGFPLQNTLTGGLRAQAVKEDNGEYQSLWVGSNYLQVRERCRRGDASGDGSGDGSGGDRNNGKCSYPSVAELMEQLYREYEQCRT